MTGDGWYFICTCGVHDCLTIQTVLRTLRQAQLPWNTRPMEVDSTTTPPTPPSGTSYAACVRCSGSQTVMYCRICGLRHCQSCSSVRLPNANNKIAYDCGICYHCRVQETDDFDEDMHFRMCPTKYAGHGVELPDHGRTWHQVPGQSKGVETPDDAFNFIQHALMRGPDNLSWMEQEHYRWYTAQGARFEHWFREYSDQRLKFENWHMMCYDVRRTTQATRQVTQDTSRVTQETQSLTGYLRQALDNQKGSTSVDLCQCGECRRTAKVGKGKSPSVARCVQCERKCCEGCLEGKTGKCWICLDYEDPVASKSAYKSVYAEHGKGPGWNPTLPTRTEVAQFAAMKSENVFG